MVSRDARGRSGYQEIFLGDCNNDQVSNEFLKEDGDNLSLEEFVDLWDIPTTVEVHTGKEGNLGDYFCLKHFCF